ncbi:MAG: diversity-generating retroelement protein Avd [Anaerolineae bacterium]|nr:diversity-generating retroelement protein Avd [Anaerolineae bacterium]
MSDDMIILTRTFDLLAWLLPKTERFPKVYRPTVTQRMMNAALDFQEALFEAMSQRGTTRQKHLRSADAALNKLRLYLRLAYHWRWLNDGQYRHVSVMVAEIGSLLGGWMKSESTPL